MKEVGYKIKAYQCEICGTVYNEKDTYNPLYAAERCEKECSCKRHKKIYYYSTENIISENKYSCYVQKRLHCKCSKCDKDFGMVTTHLSSVQHSKKAKEFKTQKKELEDNAKLWSFLGGRGCK